jgi:hypothetical protein
MLGRRRDHLRFIYMNVACGRTSEQVQRERCIMVFHDRNAPIENDTAARESAANKRMTTMLRKIAAAFVAATMLTAPVFSAPVLAQGTAAPATAAAPAKAAPPAVKTVKTVKAKRHGAKHVQHARHAHTGKHVKHVKHVKHANKGKAKFASQRMLGQASTKPASRIRAN